MTVYRTTIYVFECDAPGCEKVTGDIIPATETGGLRAAWRMARRELGWTGRDGCRYCPDHSSA